MIDIEMKLNLKSKIRDVYAHPIGRDIIDKVMLQMGKPKWLVTNPLVGALTLGTVKKLARKSGGLVDALLGLLNAEPGKPRSEAVPTEPAWWKEAVFYQIYPRSFTTRDLDNELRFGSVPDVSASGGLKGIISKLDYLKSLGVDALWLSPVYDSPNDDNGYDIRDYYKIMEEYGTMEDMDSLIAELHGRGMKLVMDLVVNHTSDEHRWFQEALKDESSPYRDYYFFRKSGGVSNGKSEPPNNWTSFFSGPAWNYYPEQDVWALHLFSKKQMDLNWECGPLREEIYAMVRWWLEKGIDGFRLDVINYISKTKGLPDGDGFIGGLMKYTGVEHYFYGPRLHEFLRELRREAFEPYNGFTVGETPGIGLHAGRLLTDAYRKELDLIFSFDHLETPGYSRFDDYLYDLSYLKQFYIGHLNADKGHGWHTLFFNNHDNPRMISKIDPMGKYSDLLAKLLAVLQFTLRGTPFIYQGDEIGAQNVKFASINDLQDVESIGLYNELIEKGVMETDAFKRCLAGTRDHARVPMRWDEVANQEKDRGSVLCFYRELISLRKKTPELVYGVLEFLDLKDGGMLNFTRTGPGGSYYIEANLRPAMRQSAAPKTAKLFIGSYGNDQTSKHSDLRPYEARVYSLEL